VGRIQLPSVLSVQESAVVRLPWWVGVCVGKTSLEMDAQTKSKMRAVAMFCVVQEVQVQ
jgi:hypothetical protein